MSHKKITQKQWLEHTTLLLREDLEKALNKLKELYLPKTGKIPTHMIGGIPAYIAGGNTSIFIASLLAASTPRWNKRDLKAFNRDNNYKTKATWIPGYAAYKNIKVMGIKKGLQERVARQAEKELKLRLKVKK